MIESTSLNYFQIEMTHVECLTECVAYQRHSKIIIHYDHGSTEKVPTTRLRGTQQARLPGPVVWGLCFGRCEGQ